MGAAAIAGALLCENGIESKRQRPTLGKTDEEIAALPYFDILAASGENRNLPCDVASYSLGDGTIHIVLPENVPENHVVVYIRDDKGSYLARRVYDLSKKVSIGSWEIVLDRHFLPILYFETDSARDFREMNESETKDIVCDGDLYMCVGGKGNKLLSTHSKASLQGRGNTSWDWASEKKSYTLKLEKAENLLGMGKNKNWNLIGNAFDVSLLKNISFNTIATKAGIPYQAQMSNVVLYVDGQYRGVYTLTTKIKAGKNNIPLKTGDYLYKMDPPVRDQEVRYNPESWYESSGFHPSADLVFPEEADAEEIDEASQRLQYFIDTIEGHGDEDIASVCDLESIARYYWIQEASMNFDSWERSVYIYYLAKDGRMHAGPVWDMDLTLGYQFDKHGVDFGSPEGWKVRNYGWYEMLFKNEEFASIATDVYFNGGVREALFSGLDEFSEEKEAMGDDAYMNFLLFGYADIGVTTDYGSTYDEYCDNMIAFYRARLEWIDEQMGLLISSVNSSE